MNFRQRSVRVATVAIGGAAVAGTAWIALPAEAATTGIVSVVETNVVTYTANPGRVNNVVLTQSGNTITVDDTTAVKAGAGCAAVSGDVTKIRCTPKVPVNWIRVDLGDGNDSVVNQSNQGMTARTRAGNDKITGGAKKDDVYAGDGNDIVSGLGGNDHLRGDAGTDTVTGGDGNDALSGSTGNDTLDGGTGNDGVLYGGPGDDIVRGGDGNDVLKGDDGTDTVDGGAGDDRLNGGGGNDKLLGGAGDLDIIYGDAGNDRLEGFTGQDNIYGGTGNDQLVGGPGTDHLKGDAGNDIENGGDGLDFFDQGLDPVGADSDTFIGGADEDVVVYWNRGKALTADADGVKGDDGAAGEKDTIEASISDIWGGDGNDRLTGTAAGDETLTGGAGNDTIRAGAGDDAVWGDGGTDNLDAGAGYDFCADAIESGETVVNCEYGSGAPAVQAARAARAEQLDRLERLRRLVTEVQR
ncbi:calcium-binding protein [Actinoplanes sp. M2I2]|uniref:calcium-binding protein n=1 Tax=Actinoplanes sp. M2I2 TaxID=1734444 RepID=UPI0020204AFE|nr:calcium-binding protein [Actinoplanes sp. M2I2]